jgi:hypothetical protein
LKERADVIRMVQLTVAVNTSFGIYSIHQRLPSERHNSRSVSHHKIHT